MSTKNFSTPGPLLFAGDCHGQFAQLIQAAQCTRASAVVLLGDMAPTQPLDLELAPLIERGQPVYWIGGNHDADSDVMWTRVWGSELAVDGIHGRVVQLPNGQRLAGLSGVFREAVWYPSPGSSRARAATWNTRAQHARQTPRQDRWQDGPHRRHWGTIYPEDINGLARSRADILVTHEASGYHPNGFAVLDDLARSMGVRLVVHGHQHDALDSSASWASQGFESRGVGLRGVSARWPDGRWEVVVPGELDDEISR